MPWCTDAGRLVEWMLEHDTKVAVFFPDFSPAYAQLAGDPRLRQITCTDYAWTRSRGHANMCVYQVIGDR